MNSSFPLFKSLCCHDRANQEKRSLLYLYMQLVRDRRNYQTSYRDEILTVLEQPLLLFLTTVTNSRKRFFESQYNTIQYNNFI